MDETTFKILEIVITVIACAVATFLIPWLKNKIGADKVDQIVNWVKQAVLFAQQTMWNENGENRKAYVIKFVKEMCDKYHVNITEEQINVLIEAAVKQMKIDQGVVFSADKGKSTASKTDAKDSKDTGKAKE